MKGKLLTAKKKMVFVASFISLMMMGVVPAFADEDVATQIATPVQKLIESFFTPFLGIVAAIGALYCVVLGVKFSKAEEPQEHEKAKKHLKNAAVGFILIFVLLLALRIAVRFFPGWVSSNAK